MPSPSALIFLHIPKTAGTTLNHILTEQYAPDQRFTLTSPVQAGIAEFRQLPEERRSQIRLLNGHMAYGLHDLFPQGARYFTILREPVDRVVSFYYFVRRTTEHYLHEASNSELSDIKSFVASGSTIAIDNFQVRLISGHWEDVPFGQVNSEHLEQAKAVLRDHIDVVGLQERFLETLLLAKDEFGWTHVSHRSQNVGTDKPARETLPDDAIKAIRELNRWDVELYNFAQELFDERVALKGLSFKMRHWAFARLNGPIYRFRTRHH